MVWNQSTEHAISLRPACKLGNLSGKQFKCLKTSKINIPKKGKESIAGRLPVISPIDHKNHSENKEMCRQGLSVPKEIQHPPLLTTAVAAASLLMMTFLAQLEFSLLEKLFYSTRHKPRSRKNSSKCHPAVAHNYSGFLPCWSLSTLDFYFLTTDVFLVTFGHSVFT